MNKDYTKFFAGFVVYTICLLLAGRVQAATLNVCKSGCTYSTIQSAIDSASSGDTVQVDDGIYTENIDFLGKAITVQSVSGAANTTIDGNQSGSVVTFNSGESSGSVLDGFTITNGNPTGGIGGTDDGGGIHCAASSPNILNCIIKNNSADNGAGVFCDIASSPIIDNCAIINNIAIGNGGGIRCVDNSSPTLTNCKINSNLANNFYGGGVSCSGNSSPTIISCEIIGNTAIRGGGIYCHTASPTIIDCRINSNSAVTGLGGGIYYLNAQSSTITSCTINNNTTELWGAGIYCQNSRLKITDSTIHNNMTTDEGWGRGGGIYASDSFLSISNCIISSNSADYGGGIFGGCLAITNCTVIGNKASVSGGGIYPDVAYVANSIFWSNGSSIYAPANYSVNVHYSDIQGGYPGLGNIDNDPLFVDPTNNDYHLGINSPCINTGQPRIYNSDGTRSDMGAYGGGVLASEPINITVALDGGGDYSSIQHAVDYAVTGDTVTVLSGKYSEDIVIGEKDISLIAQDGAASTIIDGSGFVPVVAMLGLGTDAELRGFTIQNGSGGIYGVVSSPKISDCNISSNYASHEGTNYMGHGGGICLIDSASAINNCKIINNTAYGSGGGIYCDSLNPLTSSSPTITNCIINSNTANADKKGPFYALYGGGIYGTSPGMNIIDCTISNNVVIGNPSVGTSRGGGVYGDSVVTITGCTITNNYLSANETKGGGVYGQSLTITDCNISSNLIVGNFSGTGVGVYAKDSLTITNSTVSNNSIYAGTSYGGGVVGYGDATINACTINNNSIIASHNACGGGLVAVGIATITNCTIKSNLVTVEKGYSLGGGVYYDSLNSEITNCIISGNSATTACDSCEALGGGIYFSGWAYGTTAITNCTISNNSVNGNSTYTKGGGICLSNLNQSINITNNILWENMAGEAPNEIHTYFSYGGSLTITYSNINSNYITWTETPSITLNNNINENPLFVGGGNYHLIADSPCIDAGTITGAPEYDFEGDPRLAIVGGDDMPDMGADEYVGGSLACLHDGDVNEDGNVTPADALLAFQHYLGLTILDECQQAHADVNNDGNITPADALCIFQKYLGLPSCLD